jgi:hypothetical protein
MDSASTGCTTIRSARTSRRRSVMSRSAGHHSGLVRRLAAWPAPLQAVARRYALRHALLHRAEAGGWADAWRIAGDQALDETFGAAGSSVKLVVLSACYSDVQAEALRSHVDCVVG